MFTEEHARKPGWLQRLDPRAKLGMFVATGAGRRACPTRCWSCCRSTSRSCWPQRASRVPFDFFVKRVWLGIPFFAGIVILPSIFFTAGPRLFDLALGPLHLAPSIAGLVGAVVFIARVGVSVSLAVLLVLTTPWADVLKSLQALARAAGLHPAAVDDLSLHLPVLPHCERHVRGAQEPHGRAHQRQRAPQAGSQAR